jgi:hypothetical protein
MRSRLLACGVRSAAAGWNVAVPVATGVAVDAVATGVAVDAVDAIDESVLR